METQNANTPPARLAQDSSNSLDSSSSQEDKLCYPGHSRYGEISNTSTYPKTLGQFRDKVPDALRCLYDKCLSRFTTTEKHHFTNTIQNMSDEQFGLIEKKMERMRVVDLCGGLWVLAGRHAYLKAKNYGPVMKKCEGFLSKPQPAPKGHPKVNEGPEEKSQEWSTLKSRVHALPLELLEQIEALTFDSAFLADIAINQSADVNALKCIRDQINVPALGIDRRTRQAFVDRIGSENLLVIGAGGMEFVPDFFKQFPYDIRCKIRRVQLNFARSDFFEPLRKMTPSYPYVSGPSLQGHCDEWLLFVELNYKQQPRVPFIKDLVFQHLCDTWKDKANWLRSEIYFRVKEIIFDLTDAFAPDDTFLGTEIARYLPIFPEDMVTVKAPTPELEDEIRHILVDETNPPTRLRARFAISW